MASNVIVCRDCKVDLVEQPTRRTEKQLKKPYYYTHTMKCPVCGKFYLNDKYKVANHSSMSITLDPEASKKLTMIYKIMNRNENGKTFNSIASSIIKNIKINGN